MPGFLQHSFEITILCQFLLIAHRVVMAAVILHELVSFFFRTGNVSIWNERLTVISLHLCISSRSDISAESDIYVSRALDLLRQSGINSTNSAGNLMALKINRILSVLKSSKPQLSQ